MATIKKIGKGPYNPQKASAYVGKGVLRKGGNITPVPNGPLIKKKGEFKGSTLKKGGKIRKAQVGLTTRWMSDKEYKNYNDSLRRTMKPVDPGFSITPKGESGKKDSKFSITPKDYDPNKKKRRVTSADGTIEYYKNGGSTPAWQRKEGKNPEGGLNAKGVASYRRANPGSKLKTAVTTKPSKLKPGSKSANRRKSFCARMSGMKKRLTSAKTANDPNSRINKSLRKWNC
jgi:hypothetical protein